MPAEGRAGQPLVPVGVRAVFALEPVRGPGGDPGVIGGPADGVVAQAGGGRYERPGQRRAVPAALDQQGAAGGGLDAGLAGAVVHDRLVAQRPGGQLEPAGQRGGDRKSTRLNSSHVEISYAVFCLKKKKNSNRTTLTTKTNGTSREK